MNPKEFIAKLDEPAITAAIAGAESRCSGEIRVFISRSACADPLPDAEEAFCRLGMQRTALRNGVLIFIAPKSRQFAILGDAGIHERAGRELWNTAKDAMAEAFARAEWTQGIVAAVNLAGAALARHFPPDAAGEDRNELPDMIAHDECAEPPAKTR